MTDELDRDDEREDESLREIVADEKNTISARFDAFRSALTALCVEHDIHMCGGDEYDDYETYLTVASDKQPAGCYLSITDVQPLTPEELAERDARDEAQRIADEKRAKAAQERYERQIARLHAQQAKERARQEAVLASGDRTSMEWAMVVNARDIRSEQMRVSTDPADPAYIDGRPRRVWLNDREVIGWTVADEFRRCVITPDGVLNGAVLIERLPADPGDPAVEPAPEANNNLCGMFVAVPSKPKAEPPPEPVASFAPPAVPVKPAAMSSKKRKKAR